MTQFPVSTQRFVTLSCQPPLPLPSLPSSSSPSKGLSPKRPSLRTRKASLMASLPLRFLEMPSVEPRHLDLLGKPRPNKTIAARTATITPINMSVSAAMIPPSSDRPEKADQAIIRRFPS